MTIMRGTAPLAALGLLVWLAAQGIAFSMAAAGDGWITPFFFSMPLLILYPLTLIRAFKAKPERSMVDRILPALALWLDVLFLCLDALEGGYSVRVWTVAPALPLSWLTLWFGWQVIAFVTEKRRGTKADRR